jgi:hypothetical protein
MTSRQPSYAGSELTTPTSAHDGSDSERSQMEDFEDAQESPDLSRAASNLKLMEQEAIDETPKRRAVLVPSTRHLTIKDVATTEAELRKDVVEIRTALEYFLNRPVLSSFSPSLELMIVCSRMLDAEELCLAQADSKLYYCSPLSASDLR